MITLLEILAALVLLPFALLALVVIVTSCAAFVAEIMEALKE